MKKSGLVVTALVSAGLIAASSFEVYKIGERHRIAEQTKAEREFAIRPTAEWIGKEVLLKATRHNSKAIIDPTDNGYKITIQTASRPSRFRSYAPQEKYKLSAWMQIKNGQLDPNTTYGVSVGSIGKDSLAASPDSDGDGFANLSKDKTNDIWGAIGEFRKPPARNYVSLATPQNVSSEGGDSLSEALKIVTIARTIADEAFQLPLTDPRS